MGIWQFKTEKEISASILVYQPLSFGLIGLDRSDPAVVYIGTGGTPQDVFVVGRSDGFPGQSV